MTTVKKTTNRSRTGAQKAKTASKSSMPQELRRPPRAPMRYGASMAVLANRIGVHESSLRNWIAQDAPTPPSSGSKRSIDAWVKRMEAWRVAQKARRATEHRATNQHNVDPESAAHQRDWQKWRAAKLKLEVGVQTRTLVKRTDVVELAGKAVLTVRARLNAMVTKMTARCANVPDHIVAEELQDEVDAICNAFAQGMSQTFGNIDPSDLPCPFCKQERGLSGT